MAEMTLELADDMLAHLGLSARVSWQRNGQTFTLPQVLAFLRLQCPKSPAVAEGVRILNESEDPETLVALMEVYQAGGFVTLKRMYSSITRPWAPGDWCARSPATGDKAFGITAERALFALRDALRARKEGQP